MRETARYLIVIIAIIGFMQLISYGLSGRWLHRRRYHKDFPYRIWKHISNKGCGCK